MNHSLSTEPLPRLAPFRTVFPFVFAIVLVFALSAYPKALIPQGKYISWDKLAHLAEFGTLSYITARMLYYSGRAWWHRHWVVLLFMFGVLFAISDEWHQSFVAGRLSSVFDVIADSVGVLLGYLLFNRIIQKRLQPKR
ncbi:VanZ family protein [bacterium]|nr:VanZ family protein [bacterium]MBU1652519.1 VanZ family protein [bacterium]MBU1882453.1 VanZ family protein [bacterium]